MTDIVERARAELDPDARMDAYYFGFKRTGIGAIDAVLSELAIAGKAYHHTDEWGEARTWTEGPSHESRIQAAADQAAELVRSLADVVEELRRRDESATRVIARQRADLAEVVERHTT